LLGYDTICVTASHKCAAVSYTSKELRTKRILVCFYELQTHKMNVGIPCRVVNFSVFYSAFDIFYQSVTESGKSSARSLEHFAGVNTPQFIVTATGATGVELGLSLVGYEGVSEQSDQEDSGHKDEDEEHGSHCCDCKDDCVLGCHAVYFSRRLLTFQTRLLPP
jgi:hypothetical protein